MDIDPSALPDDIDALKDIVRSALAQRDSAKADAAAAQAERSDIAAYIAYLKLQIEKLKRTIYGPRAERTARLLDQMEFELEELEATATEDELRAEQEAAKARTTTVAGSTRKRPSRQPFPDHLPRERIVLPGPSACTCCGGTRLAKLGETVTETLESHPAPAQGDPVCPGKIHLPRLRDDQPDAGAVPRHPARLRRSQPAGDDAYEKFGQHQPLNRQSERYRPRGRAAQRLDPG